MKLARATAEHTDSVRAETTVRSEREPVSRTETNKTKKAVIRKKAEAEQENVLTVRESVRI